MTEEPRTGEQQAAAEAAEAMAVLRRLKEARDRRAASVACGLVDADGCQDSDDEPCPLRDEDDCPARETRLRAAAVARAAAEAPAKRQAAAVAVGLPKRQREELGLEPGIPALAVRENDALRAVRGPEVGILVLCGPTGTGKSFAAAEWLWARRGGLWRTAGELARASWYGKDSEVDRLIAAPALVVDDLGVQVDDVKGVWKSRLGELVAARFAARRPTVLTTNATGDDLRRILDDRIKDRIRQDGAVVECVGASMRQARLSGVEG